MIKFRTFGIPSEAVMAIVNGDGYDAKMSVHHERFLQFYERLINLFYETIIKMARDPASGIKLTDTKRVNCLACTQGKQTKNVQSRT